MLETASESKKKNISNVFKLQLKVSCFLTKLTLKKENCEIFSYQTNVCFKIACFVKKFS